MDRSRGKNLLAFTSPAWSATIFSSRTRSLSISRTCRFSCNKSLITMQRDRSAGMLRQMHSGPKGSLYVTSLGTRIDLSRFGDSADFNAALAEQNGNKTRSQYAGNDLAGDCR